MTRTSPLAIHLDLARHCIETAARLKVERLIRDYFKRQGPDIEQKIRALTFFLEQADFEALRTAISRERVPGGPDHASLIVFWQASRMELQYNGSPILRLDLPQNDDRAAP